MTEDESKTEEDDEKIEADTFEEWLDEVEKRYDRVEDRFGDRRDVEKIKEKAIRPFYYFKDEMGEGESTEEPITDSQKSYLSDLAEQMTRRFYRFAEKEEDIDNVGQPADIIESLTKDQASEVIDFLNQTKDYESYKGE